MEDDVHPITRCPQVALVSPGNSFCIRAPLTGEVRQSLDFGCRRVQIAIPEDLCRRGGYSLQARLLSLTISQG